MYNKIFNMDYSINFMHFKIISPVPKLIRLIMCCMGTSGGVTVSKLD